MFKSKLNRPNRTFGKVSKKMAEMPIVKVTCGNVKGRLHKSKFYCPGIHRECIEYQGRFITPKMFSVMGDKERLKDWKNALRINGIQVRKYIESGALDFNRHDEFCTGRCIARSPVNRSQVSSSATTLSSAVSGIVPKVEFVSSINEHTYCHLPDDSEALLNIPTVEMTGDPEPVDVKPNVALLQSLLEKPPASTPDVLPADVAAAFSAGKDVDLEPISVDSATAEEDRQFWVGIMELGLLEHFFREIKINLDVYKSDLVTHQVKVKDAVRVSSVVRSMGLMNKFKTRLASFKSDMDQQQAKIDAEMEALKQRVTQFELRKQALKRKSEKFELLMDMSANKKAFIIEKNVDSDEEGGEGEEGGKEVVGVCYENDEDDDEEENEDSDEAVDADEDSMDTGLHSASTTAENSGTNVGEKWISVPSAAPATPDKPSRPLSPVKITTLPADSANSFVLKKSGMKPMTISAVPTTPTTTEPAKKVTIIRQVLMETGNDGDTMEKLKEVAVAKLKQSMNTKPTETAQPTNVVKAPTQPVPILPIGGLPKPAVPLPSSSKLKPIAPKEKIKIIARCKPIGINSSVTRTVVPTASSGQVGISKKAVFHTASLGSTPTSVLIQSKQGQVIKVGSKVTIPQPGTVVYNTCSNTLATSGESTPPSKPSPPKVKSISPITKDLKVVVQPIELKKRKPGPRSKTNYVELFPSPTSEQKDSSEEDDDENNTRIKVEAGGETTGEDKGKPVVSARRSNRKTTHMFSWGMKSGGDSQESIKEETDETLTLSNLEEISDTEIVPEIPDLTPNETECSSDIPE